MKTTFRLRTLWVAGALACILSLTGCSIITSYPSTVGKAQAAFDHGDYAGAVAQMQKMSPPSSDEALYLTETGTFQRTAADYAGSNKSYLRALDIYREFDSRATISLRDSTQYAASLLLNDKAISYRGSFYERVLLNTFLAVNFLMEGNLENARVMVMQADQRQREAKEEHEKEIEKSREEAQKKNVNSDQVTAKVRAGFGDQRAYLEKAGNIYQNAYMFYLSAIIFEMTGEVDNAYILAKRIHDMNPGFLPVRADLLRYAKQLGRGDEYDRWRSAFGSDVPDTVPAGHGRLVALHGCGSGPVKEELKVRFPVPLGANRPATDVTIAVPKFTMRGNPVEAAAVVVGDKVLGRTQPLMDVEATAVKDLWDRAMGIAIRQVLRATGRVLAQEAARQKGGDLSYAAMVVAGYVLEQADLRSWISLPRDLQAFRATLPAGEYPARLDLLAHGGAVIGHIDAGKITIKEGAITFIDARSIGVRGTAGHAVVPAR
jgi:hypothetical protein